jgi:glycosyltransferase involved in cell wall biosynthesis
MKTPGAYVPALDDGVKAMTERPLRLAVYGLVEKAAGGLASANYVVLEELLREGHEIDFYAIDPWIRPVQLFSYPNFRYIGFRLPRVESGWKLIRRLPFQAVRWAGSLTYSQMAHSFYNRAISKAIRRSHNDNSYDALLTLGLFSPFGVSNLPTVSWDQGTPIGEREGLISNRERICKLCGRGYYSSLMVFYRWRELRARRLMGPTDFVICGSKWALSSWSKFGLDPQRGFSLPYPVDLEAFKPERRGPIGDRPVRLLHLGRLVPRKRLDLVLEGFQRLRTLDTGVSLKVIGNFAYAKGFRKLLENPTLTAGVEYLPHVPYAEAREALRDADALVQTSENENFGTAVAEAQACGLPVVVGPSNGTRDYLDSDEFTFPAYEPAAVANAMARVVAAVRDRRTDLAVRAREAAEQHYSVKNVVRRLSDILRFATASKARAEQPKFQLTAMSIPQA